MTTTLPRPHLDPLLDGPLVGPRVLSLVGDESGCALWRVWQPVRFLRLHGYPCDWVPLDDPQFLDVPLGTYQAVVFCRLAWHKLERRRARAMLERWRRGGLKVFFEADDDLFTPFVVEQQLGRIHAEKTRLELERDRAAAIWVLRHCDGVTVSTQYLASTVRRYTRARVEVVPNAIDAGWFLGQQQGMHRVFPGPTIGWVGGNRPDADLEQMAMAWGRIAQRYPDVTFAVMGHQPPIIARHVPEERLLRVPWLHPDSYPKGLVGIDIGCCPLQETPFNRSKCVVGDTLIPTINGITPIAELSQSRVRGIIVPLNTRVWTTERWAMAEGFFYGGEQETIRITTRAGFQIEGTLNHPIRRATGEWAMLADLRVGDAVKIEPVQFAARRVRLPINPWAVRARRQADLAAGSLPILTIDETWGAALGYIVGDGHIGRNMVRVSCDPQDGDVVEHLAGVLARLGLTPSRKHHRPRVKTGRGVLDVMVSSARFNDVLAQLGVLQEKRKMLAVPSVILRSPRAVVRAFLMALFETDGTVSAEGSRVSFTSVSPRLAREVQLLLTGFGVFSSIRAGYNPGYAKFYYTVNLRRAGVDAFAAHLGFLGSRKSALLAQLVAKPHSNRYRDEKWADVVVKIERGKGDVYDVTVPGPAEFASGGFVSHNTPIKAYEYALSGAAVVASPTMYGRSLVHQQHAWLASTASEWETGLAYLLDDVGERQRLAATLRRQVVARWSLKANYWRWPLAWQHLWEG